MATPIILAV